MAIARLPVILVLVIVLLQTSQGQQCGLCNNSKLGLGNSITIQSEPLKGVITPVKRNSENCECRNNGATSNTQNKPLFSGLQQFLNLQQPQQTSATSTSNFQPLSVNLQTALRGQNSQQQLSIQQQNVQQSVIPLQQSLTPQQAADLLFINQQPAVSQLSNQIQQPCIQLQASCEPTKQSENLQASLNLQPVSLGKLTQQPVTQSSQSISLNNLQAIGQQTPIQKDINLEALPMINGEAQGLPSQVTQGILLSTLGLQSNLPSILPSSYTKTSSNQFTPSQNNAVSLTNAPAPLDVSQTANALPLSASSLYLPDDCAPNKPTQILLMPLTFQCNDVESNPKALGVSVFQCQEAQNPVNIKSQLPIQVQQALQGLQPVEVSIKTYPIQNQNVQYAVQNQDIPIQLVQQQATTYNQQPSEVMSVQSQLTSSVPTSFVSDPIPYTHNQPMQEYNSILALNQKMQIPFDGQSNPLTSLLLSLLQSSNSPSYDFNNQASKSSTIKSLLPLLFNLLKDQRGCCCPNCNYMNNGQDRQGTNPFMNNPFMQNYNNNSPNMVQRTEKQEEPITNTYLIYNNIPYKTNNENQNEPKPQITDSYANQSKHGQTVQKDVSQNVVESEERGLSKKAPEKKKTSTKEYQCQNFKKVKNDSAEYDYEDYDYDYDDDYGYSYENED